MSAPKINAVPDVEFSLTVKQREDFIKRAKQCNGDHVSFFNLASDSDNAPGKFADLDNAQTVAAASAAVTWMKS